LWAPRVHQRQQNACATSVITGLDPAIHADGRKSHGDDQATRSTL
jgi:hypothetical protein